MLQLPTLRRYSPLVNKEDYDSSSEDYKSLTALTTWPQWITLTLFLTNVLLFVVSITRIKNGFCNTQLDVSESPYSNHSLNPNLKATSSYCKPSDSLMLSLRYTSLLTHVL